MSIVVRQNATHIARVEGNGYVNIYEKGLKLDNLDFPEIRIRTNVTEEDVFNFFEMSDETNRFMMGKFREALLEAEIGY